MTGSVSEVANGFLTKLCAGDFGGAFALVSDDIRYVIIGTTPASGVYCGRDEITKRLSPLLGQLKNLKSTLKEVIVDGDRVVAFVRGEAEAPYGHYLQDPCIFVLRVAGNKVIEILEFVDTVMLETAVFGKKLLSP
jgi:ketosteroid isomerase-like protein